MWMLDKPTKAAEIAKEIGLGFPSVMMHIIGLIRMEYVKSPQKGQYVITKEGKRALGFPKVDREKAEKILAYLPMEKSFHFYADIGKPINLYATSLQDFSEKILKADVGSIKFHLDRGDFEAWFTELGDIELARKTLLFKEQKLSDEELPRKLHEIVKQRCEQLAKIRQQPH